MEGYAKIILYAYPLLETVERDYEEHIRNRAVLSYFARGTAEEQATYIADEIIEMRKLEGLKACVKGVLSKLSEVENALVAIRYFGKTKRIKERLKGLCERSCAWTERTYFRRQRRLGEKLASLLRGAGLTKEAYEREYADMELFQTVRRYVERGGEQKISQRERRGVTATE